MTTANAPAPPPSPGPAELRGPGPRGEERSHWSILVPVAVSSIPLLWPAFLNGYPLVFSDTGTYLSQAINHYVGWDRPVFYSLFLLPLHMTLTTWPVIVAQSLIVAHLLRLGLRVLHPGASVWWQVPLAIFLAVCTSLPWFVAELTPDMFTGLLVLALGLLMFCAAALSRAECIWLTLLSAFMMAVHLSHLPLAVLLLLTALAVSHTLGVRTGRDMLRPALSIGLAVAALLTVNLVAHRRLSLAPYGNVFLLARVIYDGPGERVLARECPRHAWRLCAYRHRFPPTADMFLWRADGPIIKAGGAKLVSADADAIVAAAVAAEPGAELAALMENTGQQLAMFRTGDGLHAWPDTVTPWIRRDFPPAELARFVSSLQANNRLPVPEWMAWGHTLVALAGVAGCLILLPRACRKHPALAGLLALALLALPANALITGGLSGPHDRYQSRIMWLPSLMVVLALPALMRRPE
jgi:hypothetical protein